MTEAWLTCLDGRFEVSDLGHVRRIKGRYQRHCRPLPWPMQMKRVGAGYLGFTPSLDGQKVRTVYLHDLVATAFLGQRPAGYEVNHKNGVKHDCRVTNLEYVTRGENTAHAYRTGLRHTRLTPEEAADIRALGEIGIPAGLLSIAFAIDSSTVHRIIRGRLWASLALVKRS